MTTRTFLNNFNSKIEQNTYEDLLGEFTQVYGIDVIYIPRESYGTFDLLFGDDPVKKYANNYTIECYIKTVDNFQGGEFFSKFGLQVKKQATFLMPNRAWRREVQGAILRPQEGDLLYVSLFGSLMEVKYVNEENIFYPLGKGVSDPQSPETNFFAFELITEKFRYNDETIDTTIPEISSIVNSLISTYNFNMANTANTGSYQNGEAVYQTSNNNIHGSPTSTGTVNDWDLITGVLQLNTIQGLFLPNTYIFGANSGAAWILDNYNILQNINNPLMDNFDISEAANTILNFSSDNPFGQP